MIDHLSITVTDLDRSTQFYDAVMAALGYPEVKRTESSIGYGVRCSAEEFGGSYISVVASDRVVADRRHWCFKAPTRAAVDRFHRDAVAAGGRDDGPPGLRPRYHPHYYAAFVLDPDGNRIEAVCHARPDGESAS